MNITDIISKSVKPSLYEKGTSFMWTDKHISKQILSIHLNPDIDLGSRKKTSVIETANWILKSQKEKGKLKILDLGCGPGIYAEIFAENGHSVTGVDISETSVSYARSSAAEKGLNINYIHASYLEFSPEKNSYDLIVLIYTDLGVLNPQEREILLKMVYSALKPGGTFIFDVLRDNNLEIKKTPNSWEAVHKGFWKDASYLALSESFLYKEQKVILYQHHVIDSGEQIETYRFWTHFFNQQDIINMLEKHGFGAHYFKDDLLPDDNIWNGNNVIFTLTSKI